MPSELSTLQSFASLTADARRRALREAARASGLSEAELKRALAEDWRVVGRPKQQPPDWRWTYFLIIAGRGWGKTRAGAQWARVKALDAIPGGRGALVAPTLSDVRRTMVEGESGLLSILPAEALRGQSRDRAWNRGTCELFLANGGKLEGFSSEVPDRIRGPQFHWAWVEEASSFDDAQKGDALETTWSNLKLATRLGDLPQFCVTTTPKANRLTKDLLAIDPAVIAVVRGSSYENRENLSDEWWRTVVAPLEGTRTGRQEIHAELLEDVEGALWTTGLLDRLRVPVAPPLARVVVGVDPNASSGEAANSAGVVVAGCDSAPLLTRRGYVLADRTVTRGGPRAWAQAAVDAYHDFDADLIVAEKNQGGEMVEVMLKTVDPAVPVKLVSASRGKRTRAEPVASIYAGSETVEPRVFHVGTFPELESEMCTWTPEAESPDRMDACVWTLTELMLQGGGPMRVQSAVGFRIPGVAGRA